MTTDARIVARRLHLTRLRAERKDELDLPRTLTMRQVREYATETAKIDQQIADFEAKAAAWAALPTLEPDTKWRGHLVAWRETLNAELLAMHPRIRNEKELDQKTALDWAIRLIDFGLGISSLGIVTLEPSRIGPLMQAAGYEVQGEALRGPRGWRGGLAEVEARLKALTKQRAAAEADLTSVLLTDDERVKAEAESQAHRDALNTMDLKANADGTGLLAFTKNGDPLDVADMTPAQRAAFTRFEAAAYPPRETVTS
jgi:hypothetical protein